MLTGSVPKLLQEAGKIKEALEAIGVGLPDSISAADVETKITALETAVSEVDALNAEKTRLINVKGEQSEALSDYIVRVRSAVKGIFGPDSSEYEMLGGKRSSERKKPKKKEKKKYGKD